MPHPSNIIYVQSGEAAQLTGLTRDLASGYSSSDDARLIFDLPILAHEIPRRLKHTVNRFRLEDTAGYLIIRGHHIDQSRIGPTPQDWKVNRLPSQTFPEDLLLLLYASLLGDPFGWRTQQNGHLVHEVFPIERDQHMQLGTGSLELLTWHTEDAFHPFSADYLLLLALRNHDSVPTTIGRLPPAGLNLDLVEILFQERFFIKPDESHLAKNNSVSNAAAFAAIEAMQTHPRPIAVFSGDRHAPYICLDPYFMFTAERDEPAREALAALQDLIDAGLEDAVLESGDILIIDNRRVVHGRRPFQPRYDGQDRWLKRVNVTRDIRKSRSWRTSEVPHLIG